MHTRPVEPHITTLLLPPPNEVWGKVTYSQVSVCLSLDRYSTGQRPPEQRPPGQGFPGQRPLFTETFLGQRLPWTLDRDSHGQRLPIRSRAGGAYPTVMHFEEEIKF